MFTISVNETTKTVTVTTENWGISFPTNTVINLTIPQLLQYAEETVSLIQE